VTPWPRLALAWALAALFVAPPASAWIEKRVHGDSVTIDVERDGRAVVTHELLYGVRGAALFELSVEPVDADARPLPEATATRAKSGRDAGFPLPLEVAKDGSRIDLRVVGDKGLKGGVYLIRFRYETDLRAAGRLTAGAKGTAVDWQGPRFGDGIDSARVVFRIPASAAPPRLRSAEPGFARATEGEDEGVFLSTFRRAGDKDELEVVRPHVAKDEGVSWRIVADARAFDVAPPRFAAAPVDALPRSPEGFPRVAPRPRIPWLAASGVLGGALFFAVLVVLKTVWVRRSYEAIRATPRTVIPAPVVARALLGALGVVGAAGCLYLGVPAALAAPCAVVALAAAAHLPPKLTLPLRGPGRWTRLEPEILAEDGPRRAPHPARFLDAGHPLGFVVFLSGLAGFVAGAIATFRVSPYHGVAVGLGSSLLFPIFFTGRAGEVPRDRADAPRELLEWLFERIEKDARLEAWPIGRLPDGVSLPDELRLHVMPKRPLIGAAAIEIGMDVHSGALGAVELPFVIARVTDGSPAAEALPKGLFWSRGRAADERVAVLRPRVPTRQVTLDLVLDLVRLFDAPKARTGASAEPARAPHRVRAAAAHAT